MIEDVDEGKSALDFARSTHTATSAPCQPLRLAAARPSARRRDPAALLINAGLWDLPPDEELNEDLRAMELKYSDRRQTLDGKTRPVAILIAKRPPMKYEQSRTTASHPRPLAQVMS